MSTDHRTVVAPARPAIRAGRHRRDLGRLTYILMILPAGITIFLIIAFPLAYTLWMAVHEYSMGASGPPPVVPGKSIAALPAAPKPAIAYQFSPQSPAPGSLADLQKSSMAPPAASQR